ASDGKRCSGGQDAQHVGLNSGQVLLLTEQVSPSLERLLPARVLLPPLATALLLPGAHPVFFPALMTLGSQPKPCTCSIEMADTHTNTKLLLQGLGHHVTWTFWRGLAVGLEPLQDRFTQFVGMSLSSISQVCLPLSAHFLRQSVTRRAADLNS